VIQIHDEKCILSITRDLTERIQAELDRQEVLIRLGQAYEATLQGWARALEMREHETANHSRRVVEYSIRMAVELGIKGSQLVNIRRGALLHDIGKMGVPDSILLKPGSLTPEEWAIMRQHTVFAKTMLSEIEYLRPCITIPYHHHEKWDGSGYPLGLAGEKIPLEARLFAVIDVYDALTHDRPYRLAWTREKAASYLLEQKGSHFDPQVVDLFLKVLDRDEKENNIGA
jgi:putative nucleotidyltransferase with HDIG domain